MELGLFSKMKIILQMLFSSFMSIELVLFFFLFLLLLIFNIKIKNKIVPIVLSVFSIVGILSFVLYFPSGICFKIKLLFYANLIYELLLSVTNILFPSI